MVMDSPAHAQSLSTARSAKVTATSRGKRLGLIKRQFKILLANVEGNAVPDDCGLRSSGASKLPDT